MMMPRWRRCSKVRGAAHFFHDCRFTSRPRRDRVQFTDERTARRRAVVNHKLKLRESFPKLATPLPLMPPWPAFAFHGVPHFETIAK
jgi:hypothetical protein